MGRSFIRFSVGRAGTSAANVHYITREPATNGDRDSVLVRNYPDEVTEARDYDELRDRLEEYADQQETEELERPRRGGGETRTHYRVILSFEQETDPHQARDMAGEYLDREFPDARAVAAVHQDTDHTHVHIHIQARDADDHKLHFDRETYHELDRAWEDIYDREFGRDHEDNESVMERDRYFDYEEREADLYGRDEAGDRADEREAPDGGQETDRDQRAIEDSARELDRADEESRDTLRTAEDVADRLDERSPDELDRDQLLDRDLDRDDYRDFDDRGR